MKVNVKSAPKKFEPKTVEITVESFEELKGLRNGLKGHPASSCTRYIGNIRAMFDKLYKDALDNGEVDCDF